MKWHGISEVAKIVNRSRQAVYKKIKRLPLGEKLALGEHLMENGQIQLSEVAIEKVFGVSPSDNQVDTGVVSQVVSTVDKVDRQVDRQVDTEVVAGLKNQLTDKEREVVRLDNLLTNLLSQLEEERRQRGEDRIRTDTILMKLTNDISSLQKALEYKATEEKATPAEKEKPLPVAIPEPPAPIRAEVPRKVIQKPEVQRNLSTWESVTVFLDDLMGFALGRG